MEAQQAARAALKALANRRDALSSQMLALAEELEATGAGVSGRLVDSEGFPRADVDLYAVRAARGRLASLKTDYEEATRQLEAGLAALHASFSGGGGGGASAPPASRGGGRQEEADGVPMAT